MTEYAQGRRAIEDIVEELQSVDAAQQTLADLARMMDHLLHANDGTEIDVSAAAAVIRQEALRQRFRESREGIDEGSDEAAGDASCSVEIW